MVNGYASFRPQVTISFTTEQAHDYTIKSFLHVPKYVISILRRKYVIWEQPESIITHIYECKS